MNREDHIHPVGTVFQLKTGIEAVNFVIIQHVKKGQSEECSNLNCYKVFRATDNKIFDAPTISINDAIKVVFTPIIEEEEYTPLATFNLPSI